MPTVEERLAYLEGKVEEHGRNTGGMRDALASLEARMDHRFLAVDARFVALEDKMDRRFDAVDARFAAVDARFAALETKLDGRFDAVDLKLGWLTGILVTGMAAMLAVAGGMLASMR